jgi:predicted ATPase
MLLLLFINLFINLSIIEIYQGTDAANDELKLLEGELSSVQELKFAFRRAASRLTEMAGKEYLKNWKLKYKTA